jgi:hypothetical protein
MCEWHEIGADQWCITIGGARLGKRNFDQQWQKQSHNLDIETHFFVLKIYYKFEHSELNHLGLNSTRNHGGSAMKTILVVVIFLVASSFPACSGLRSERHARFPAGEKCTLGDSLEETTPKTLCQLNPREGVDANGRVHMRFGETRCSLWLKNCRNRACYMIWDYSYLLQNDLDLNAIERYDDLKVCIRLFPVHAAILVKLWISTKVNDTR